MKVNRYSKVTQAELDRMRELAKTMNSLEIAREMKRGVATIRERLRDMGVEPLRFCTECERNRPSGDFEGPQKQICVRHKAKTRMKKPFIQDYHEHVASLFLKDVAPLQAMWPATNPGEFKNQYVGLPEGP